MRIASFLLALLLALSGFLYDSFYVKLLPVDALVFHIVIGFSCIFIFIISFQGKIKLSGTVKIILMGMLVIVLVGLISSLNSGTGNILALASRLSSMALAAAFFVSGYQVWGGFLLKKFTIYFLFISVSFAVLIPLTFPKNFNLNWAAITLFFALSFYIISSENISKLRVFLCLLLVGLYSIVVFKSRGVALGCFLAVIYIIVIQLPFFMIEKYIHIITFKIIPFLEILVACLGVWIYNSSYYEYLSRLSIQVFHKNFDSSRLERWNKIYEVFPGHPVIGWGIDTNLFRITGVGDFGYTHNLWWDYILRFGLVGALILFSIFFIVSSKISKTAGMADTCVYLCVFVFVSVYALGGFSHWPGSFMMWFIFGLLIRKSDFGPPSTLRMK